MREHYCDDGVYEFDFMMEDLEGVIGAIFRY